MSGEPQYTIRRIQSGDADGLLHFYNGLSTTSNRTFQPLGTKTTLDVCLDIIQDNGPDRDKKIDLIALCGTRIIGSCFLWNLESDKPTLGLGIADDHQGKGLGGKLMDHVMTAARERGLRKVFLSVVKDNEVARRMYEKRGFLRCDEYITEDGLTYLGMAAELPTRRKR